MLPTLLILLFTGIMVASIWVARRASDKQTEQVSRQQQARLLKNRLDDIADICTALLRYDGNEALLTSICDFRVAQAQRRTALLDQAENDPELALAEGFRQDLPHALAERREGLPQADSDIHFMKRQFFRTIKLIKLMQSQSYFMDAEVTDHVRRLQVLILKADVNALVQHGRQLLKEEDRVNAATYFKHAKETLVASSLAFPERSSMIRRISRMIWGMYSSEVDDEELDQELGNVTAIDPDVEAGTEAEDLADPPDEETTPESPDRTA